MDGVVWNPPGEYAMGEELHAWLRAGTLPAVLVLAGTRVPTVVSLVRDRSEDFLDLGAPEVAWRHFASTWLMFVGASGSLAGR